MESHRQIELELELGAGDFLLRLNGVAINVKIKKPAKSASEECLVSPATFDKEPAPYSAPMAIPAEGGVASETDRLTKELDYYRQASQEIYEGLGKLAKEINVSIQGLSLAEIMQTGLASPGERLDQMRNQVTDVLQMTEKATLNILDLVEVIREDCEAVQGQLLHLTQDQETSEFGAEGQAVGLPEEGPSRELWDQLLSQGELLGAQLKSLTQEKPPEAAATSQIPHFPLAEVIQIVLEFCSNDTVKQHLRAVQAQQNTVFDAAAVEQAIRQLAHSLTMEDGFYQFPVEQVLTILKDHCNDERVKGLISKMLGSVAKLFPMPELPLEGHPVASEPPAALAEASGQTEIYPLWEDFFQKVQHLAHLSEAMRAYSSPGGDGAAAIAQEALGKVERITSSLSRITEALAFQDLSGQRLLKVLQILRQLQVQVLTLLVAAGQKLKMRLEGQDLSPESQDDLVQKDLDRMLQGLTHFTSENGQCAAIPDDQPLDQDAVNELLTSLGF